MLEFLTYVEAMLQRKGSGARQGVDVMASPAEFVRALKPVRSEWQRVREALSTGQSVGSLQVRDGLLFCLAESPLSAPNASPVSGQLLIRGRRRSHRH